MQSELTDFDETIKERPVFLRTLCILTFVFSSFNIISNIVSVVNPERAAGMITNSKQRINDSLSNKKINSKDPNVNFRKKMMITLSGFSPDKIRKSAWGNIITSLFCIIGAFFMWNLKKMGYYIYCVGIIASIAVPYYLFGSNFIGVFMYASAAFFGALFLIFYGMNLKSMTK